LSISQVINEVLKMADTLRTDQRLISNNNDSLTSNNGRFRLVMQNDGNLVLYDGNSVRWATGTNGRDVEFCIMQSDGNLVLYLEGSGSATWASNTNGNPGSYLVVQDDGNLVIYKPYHPIWATNTNG
jgi:hypothetical protein